MSISSVSPYDYYCTFLRTLWPQREKKTLVIAQDLFMYLLKKTRFNNKDQPGKPLTMNTVDDVSEGLRTQGSLHKTSTMSAFSSSGREDMSRTSPKSIKTKLYSKSKKQPKQGTFQVTGASACVLGAVFALHCVLVLLTAAAGGLHYFRAFHVQKLAFPHEFGKDDLNNCLPSTDNFQDLRVTENITRQEAKMIAKKHGMAVVPSVLTKKTAQEFRDYVMKANQKLADQVYVHEKEHRYNLMPDAHDPIVQEALKQVGEHPILKPLIDDVMGPGATLINLSVLTVEYGAKDQSLHGDTSTSYASLPEYIVPEYTLVIALQDTTESMGATHICPGTHFCDEVIGVEHEDEEQEMHLANEICPLRAAVDQGDAFLYQSDMKHRGTAHTDPNAPERAFVFLIFAGSQQGPDDKRHLPFGQVRALKWHLWGHTIDDFVALEHRPWRWWHSFGIFNNRQNSTVRPWTLIDELKMIFADDEESVHVVSKDHNFDKEDFDKIVDALLGWGILAVSLDLLIVLPLLLVCLVYFMGGTATGRSEVEDDCEKVKGE